MRGSDTSTSRVHATGSSGRGTAWLRRTFSDRGASRSPWFTSGRPASEKVRSLVRERSGMSPESTQENGNRLLTKSTRTKSEVAHIVGPRGWWAYRQRDEDDDE